MSLKLNITNTVNPKKIDKSKFGNKHPFNNKESHDALLEFIETKLASDLTNRNARIARFANIDQAVSGWILKYSDSDQDRLDIKKETGEPAMVKQNLNLIQMHLDDMTAFYLDIFAPTRGVYFAMGDAGKNEDIQKMAKLLSMHAKNTSRVKELNRFFTNAVKYNFGGIHTYWKIEHGTVVSNDDAGQLKTTDNEITWQGNAVDSLDVYNVFWDPNYDAIDVYKDGEWCAEAEVVSLFDIMRKNRQGIYHNVESLSSIDPQTERTYKYYKSPPQEARMDNVNATSRNDSGQDFSKIWNYDSNKRDSGKAMELVHVYAFLSPSKWNLGQTEDYKLFKLTLANGSTFIQIAEQNNVHNWLPYNFVRPIDDQMGGSQKSFSEVLTPLQDFASFCMNIHSEGVRSQIYGTRIFNSKYIDVDQIPKGEVNMNIPTKASAGDVPMTNIVYKIDSQVETEQVMRAMSQMLELANQFFPATQMPAQVAGMDRAVTSQVSAAVQGANKRLKKYGRVMVDQGLEPSKRMQILNAQQYFKGEETVNEGEGMESITPQNLRNITVSANIGHGLMTLDREKMVEDLKALLFAVLQSQAATQQIDVVNLLSAIGTFMDFGIDFDKFRLQQQPQQPPQDGQGDNNVPQGIAEGDGTGQIPAAQ